MPSVDLRSKISLDSTQFERGLRRVKTASANTGKAIGKGFLKVSSIIGNVAKNAAKFAAIIGTISFGAIVAGSAKLLSSAIKVASTYEQIRIKTRMFVGNVSDAEAMMKRIQKFAGATPFETRGLQTQQKSSTCSCSCSCFVFSPST